MAMADRAFWLALSRLWSRWADVLVILKPDTVVRWHRAGFRLFWRWKYRSRGPAESDVSAEVKALPEKRVARDVPPTVADGPSLPGCRFPLRHVDDPGRNPRLRDHDDNAKARAPSGNAGQDDSWARDRR